MYGYHYCSSRWQHRQMCAHVNEFLIEILNIWIICRGALSLLLGHLILVHMNFFLLGHMKSLLYGTCKENCCCSWKNRDFFTKLNDLWFPATESSFCNMRDTLSNFCRHVNKATVISYPFNLFILFLPNDALMFHP